MLVFVRIMLRDESVCSRDVEDLLMEKAKDRTQCPNQFWKGKERERPGVSGPS